MFSWYPFSLLNIKLGDQQFRAHILICPQIKSTQKIKVKVGIVEKHFLNYRIKNIGPTVDNSYSESIKLSGVAPKIAYATQFTHQDRVLLW